MSSRQPRVIPLQRGRARGRRGNNAPRGRGDSNTLRGRGRGRGRIRGRGTSTVIKPMPLNPPNSTASRSYRGKRQKNQPIIGRTSSNIDSGFELKEWQKTPSIILREYCQQRKRKNPFFKNAFISNAELQIFSKRYSIPLQNAGSRAHRRRVILPNKLNDRSKDLTFCSKEVYRTQKHSEHMTALLALHSLCPSLPLERKLPDAYAQIWKSFGTDYHKVHATSRFKSKHERQMHENTKSTWRQKNERQKEQYQYERWAHLTRVHMNEKLRENIQNILREQYIKISKENKHNDDKKQKIFNSLQSFLDEDGIRSKAKEIEKAIVNKEKIARFVEILVGKLCGLGFNKKDAKRAVLLTAAMDFVNGKEEIDEYVVSKDKSTLETGTKVIKQYSTDDRYEINVDKHISDAVTWCCLHLKEDKLPHKYAAKGKQFEVFPAKKDKKGYEDDDDDDFEVAFANDVMTGCYFWLRQYGFPKRITAKLIKDNPTDNKYVILGKLYRLLVEEIGNDALKKTLDIDIDDEMVKESNNAIENELESLKYMFEIKINKHKKDYIWSKTFKFDNGRDGIIEIHRKMQCKGFSCYPVQIPMITFRSTNNSIPYKQCQQIMQCLIQETMDIIGGEMSFTLIQWVDDNVQKLMNNAKDKRYETVKLDKEWNMEIKEEKKEIEKEEKVEEIQKELYDIFAIKKEKSLKNNDGLNEYLYKRTQNKAKMNQKYQQYIRLRQALPAWKCRDTIIDLMENNQVLVISGETGCGKSTQIPQFILNHYINTMRGSMCNIIVTQPRRISAVGLAERVSTERVEYVGDTVGYSIRLENRLSDRTQITYCTTGILLRRLMSSLKIHSVSHVIIDEVHERSIDIDFLLVILKFLIQKKRKDLKLILMSATLDASAFSEYFGKCPVLEIPGRTFPVKTLFLEDLLKESGIHLPRAKWSRLNREEERLRGKELKEKGIYRDRLNVYSDRVFNELAKWDERDHHRIDIELVVNTLFHIIRRFPLQTDDNRVAQQAILVFLPGMYEINAIARMFGDKIESKQMDYNTFWIIPLHSSLPTMNQKRIFETAPNGIRKIVLSTNIAETSITINDVKYVIDCGKMRQMCFDPNKKISMLREEWISRAHSAQRQGRAGRVGPGVCYKLYTLDKFTNNMCESPVPELLRSSLENVALNIKLLRTLAKSIKKNKDVDGIRAVLEECIDPPSTQLIQTSVFGLRQVGALDENELLTPLGFHLAKLPVSNVRLGKMLIFGAIFECLTPVLIIAAILTGKKIYRRARDDQARSNLDNLKSKYYNMSLKSDHITMYKIYVEWKKELLSHGIRGAKTFSYEHCLSYIALEQIDGIIKQYCRALGECGFVDKSYNFVRCFIAQEHKLDTNSRSIKLIKAILTAGLYPNVICIKMPKAKFDKTLTGATQREADAHSIRFYLYPNRERIFINYESSLSSETQFECKYLIYLTKIEIKRLQAYDVTMTTPYSLLFFGANIHINHSLSIISVASSYSSIRFIAPSRCAVLITELKKMLNYLMIKKIANPKTDIAKEPVVKAIQTLLKTDGL